MTPPRIILVNRFYWPDQPATAQLLTDLAEGLVRNRFLVTVIASRTERSHVSTETRHGVQIRRIRTGGWGRHILAGRAIAFTAFLIGGRRELRVLLRPQDVLVTMTDPPLLGPVLAGIVAQRGAHWIHWIQDIFPEVAMAVSGKTWLSALIPWRDRAWRAANHCVVPGHDMAALVRRHGVPDARLTVSENWGPVGLRPAETSAWRKKQGLVGRFVVMYSGNLGRVHDFAAIVPLAAAVGPESGVTFVFVGEGALKHTLQREVEAAGLTHVLFLPAQPREELAEILTAADLHLITLREGCEDLVFPSKLYGIAAVGRPALVIGPAGSEPGRIVSDHGFGAAYSSREIPALAAFIHRLQAEPARALALGQAALRFSEEYGQASRALTTWIGVLTPLIQLAPPGDPQASSESSP